MGRKANMSWILECFPISSGSTHSCLCIGSVETRNETIEKKPLIGKHSEEDVVQLKDDKVVGKQALAFQLKPNMVMLKVSMHCNGCARKVEKHISKIEGVSSYKVDLESKMVVITGDIVPVEVLESVSRVKKAEFWSSAQ